MPIGPLRLTGFLTERCLEAETIHRVTGVPAAVDALARDELSVVSWNIAYGRQPERVLEVLGRLDADVCLLQEVDVGCRRSRFMNVAAWLAERLAMNWLFAGGFQEIGQGRAGEPALTGQAILSRFALTDPGVIPFSRQAKWRWHASPLQPRRGVRIALWAHTAGIRAYNLHVESGKNDAFRRAQIDDVVAAERRRRGESEPVVIGGDFNCGRFGHAPLLDMLRRVGFDDPLEGHPASRRTSIRHRHALDWLFIRQLKPIAAGVADHGGASDHFPVFAKLQRV